MSRRARGHAHARAGLLGNPSDVYEGKAIAFAIADFRAEVELEEAAHFEIVPGPAERLVFDHLGEAATAARLAGCDDGIRLLRAAIVRFAARFPDAAADPTARFQLRYRTDVPRQVGLAGSSAIVVAALRALLAWFDLELHPAELAELALRAETDDLGITAGPMDRVVQAYGGVVAMDFREPRGPESYRRLDPDSLPPLFVAFDPEVGEVSGKAHGDVRLRWLRGDPEVREAIASLPPLVDAGLDCLASGDHDGFRALVDRNFDTRARIFPLADRDREMVALGREHGAAVKMCGSGGAVVGVPASADDVPELVDAYAARGYRAFPPRLERDACG